MLNKEIYNITIIGAGNGGRAFAVYLSCLGYNVTLVYRNSKKIQKIKLTRRILSFGKIKGIYKIKSITNNYKKAIENADLILYVLPASAHLSITKKITPFLKNNQIILLNPGRTWGAVEVYNNIIRSRPLIKVYVGETQTLLFTCRKIKDFGVSILKIKNSIDFCFYPEMDNELISPIITSLFPQMKLVHDIRITSLNNMGAVIHPVVSIMNTGSITRKSQFHFYTEGVSENIANLVKKVDYERCKILKCIDIKSETLLEWAEHAYGCKADDYYQIFHQIPSYNSIEAPTSLKIRYLTEDIPTGLVPLSSIGKFFGISTPNINSVIVIANSLLNTNFYRRGRTIENNPMLKSIITKKRHYYYSQFSRTTEPIKSVHYNNFE